MSPYHPKCKVVLCSKLSMVTTTNKTSCVGKSPTPTSKRCKNAKWSRFFQIGLNAGTKSLYIVFPHDSFQPGLLCHRLWGQPTQPPLVWARDYNHVRIVNLSWCFIMISECNFFMICFNLFMFASGTWWPAARWWTLTKLGAGLLLATSSIGSCLSWRSAWKYL